MNQHTHILETDAFIHTLRLTELDHVLSFELKCLPDTGSLLHDESASAWMRECCQPYDEDQRPKILHTSSSVLVSCGQRSRKLFYQQLPRDADQDAILEAIKCVMEFWIQYQTQQNIS